MSTPCSQLPSSGPFWRFVLLVISLGLLFATPAFAGRLRNHEKQERLRVCGDEGDPRLRADLGAIVKMDGSAIDFYLVKVREESGTESAAICLTTFRPQKELLNRLGNYYLLDTNSDSVWLISGSPRDIAVDLSGCTPIYHTEVHKPSTANTGYSSLLMAGFVLLVGAIVSWKLIQNYLRP